MWQAIAFANGEWREIKVFSREGNPPSPKAWLDLANDAIEPPYRGLLRHFAQEVEFSRRPYIGRAAIELWAKEAENENKEFNFSSPGLIEEHEGALALTWREKLDSGEPNNPVTLAWHDCTMVMFALTGEEEQVILQYVPSQYDQKRADFYRHTYATPRHRCEMALEWRGYFGRDCAVVDFWQRMRGDGNGYIVSLRGTAGYVTGCVTRRLLGHRGPLYKCDPTRASRLVNMKNQFPDVAQAVPDLAEIGTSGITASSAIVFVHGTFSCGLQGLKDLYPPASLKSGDPEAEPRHVYRYEHDTFASVTDNASNLADLIGKRLSAGRLLIAAHSRGGLVARHAAQLLANSHYSGQIDVYTFGTPHHGTPLTHMGRGVLKALLNVGEFVVGAIPFCSPLVKAIGYVYSPEDLPPGIAVMDERSQELASLNSLTRSRRVSAWGSKFDVNTSASGFGIETTGFLLGSFGSISNDLVVPTSSALGCGTIQPVLKCSHTQYFSDPTIRSAIRAFEPPLLPPHVTKPLSGPPPIIVDDDDTVTIGGVRLAKRKN